MCFSSPVSFRTNIPRAGSGDISIFTNSSRIRSLAMAVSVSACSFIRREGVLLNIPVHLRRNPHRPHHPQRILREPLARIAHRPDRAFVQVGDTVVGVNENFP